MEGFKQQKKIACFKEGGQVGYKSRKEHSESKEMSQDIKQDKAIVKKGVAQHEAAKHKGEPKTELKLKTGGRAKKEKGTVKKYAAGKGVTQEQSAAYKTRLQADTDTAKKIVAGELPAQSTPGTMTSAERRASIAKAFGPKLKTGGKVNKYCGGSSVKKMADGSLTEKIMGTPEQNAAAKKTLDKVAKQDTMVGALERGAQKAANFVKGQGAVTDAERAMAESAAVKKKRGGKC